MTADILIVDDDRDTLDVLRQYLESEGKSVACAVSAEDALRKIEAGNRFPLLLTDWKMPGLDGIALARAVAVSAPKTTVYLMTGDISPSIPGLAREAGISGVLNKPFSPQMLLETVNGVTCR